VTWPLSVSEAFGWQDQEQALSTKLTLKRRA